jgi:hypothetical protein
VHALRAGLYQRGSLRIKNFGSGAIGSSTGAISTGRANCPNNFNPQAELAHVRSVTGSPEGCGASDIVSPRPLAPC